MNPPVITEHPPYLTVELVPRSCFFSNLRSNLRGRDWKALRQACIEAAGHRCEICGRDDRYRALECHEIWDYNDEACVQSLTGLISLCRDCHRVKHMALARHMGWHEQAERHFMRVNGWDARRTRDYLAAVFALFEWRSALDWQLDITWLEGRGITLPQTLDREAGCPAPIED